MLAEYAAIDATLPSDICALAQSMRPLSSGRLSIEADALRWHGLLTTRGYEAFALDVMKDEVMMHGAMPKATLQHLMNIILSTHQQVLFGLTCANLAKAAIERSSVRRALAIVKERAAHGPGTYWQCLAHAGSGESPTIRELLYIVLGVRSYCKPGPGKEDGDDKFSRRVDLTTHRTLPNFASIFCETSRERPS